MPPRSRLTSFFLFSDAKSAELRDSGRQRVSPNEILEYWRNLSDAERKQYEDKAAKACAAYLEDCTQREVQRLAEGGDEEEAEGEEEDGEDGGEGDGEGKGETSVQVPLSRVKRSDDIAILRPFAPGLLARIRLNEDLVADMERLERLEHPL